MGARHKDWGLLDADSLEPNAFQDPEPRQNLILEGFTSMIGHGGSMCETTFTEEHVGARNVGLRANGEPNFPFTIDMQSFDELEDNPWN
jgi:hypothetical protein